MCIEVSISSGWVCKGNGKREGGDCSVDFGVDACSVICYDKDFREIE